jgi:F-box protein 11
MSCHFIVTSFHCLVIVISSHFQRHVKSLSSHFIVIVMSSNCQRHVVVTLPSPPPLILKIVSFGVLAVNSSRGLFLRNRIASHKSSAVCVRTAAAPHFKDNEIFKSEAAGVWVTERGAGLFEDNKIYENELVGVAIDDRATPTLRANKIFKNLADGLHVALMAAPMLEENEIFENARHGAVVSREGAPTLVRNHVTSNKRIGILFADFGRGILEDNKITNNEEVNVAVETEAAPNIRSGNLIARARGHGVVVTSRGTFVALAGCQIEANGRDGVRVELDAGASSPRGAVSGGGSGAKRLLKNKCGINFWEVGGNGENGVNFCDRSHGSARRNDIFDNAFAVGGGGGMC